MAIQYRPLFRRLIVFTTPKIERRTKSGLYVPNSRRGTFSSLMRAWVFSAGNKCHTPWQRGQCVVAQDMFEFEEFPHQIWEQYHDDPAFAELKKFSVKYEAVVSTQILMEASILAVDDDFNAEADEALIKTKNYQHYVG